MYCGYCFLQLNSLWNVPQTIVTSLLAIYELCQCKIAYLKYDLLIYTSPPMTKWIYEKERPIAEMLFSNSSLLCIITFRFL